METSKFIRLVADRVYTIATRHHNDPKLGDAIVVSGFQSEQIDQLQVYLQNKYDFTTYKLALSVISAIEFPVLQFNELRKTKQKIVTFLPVGKDIKLKNFEDVTDLNSKVIFQENIDEILKNEIPEEFSKSLNVDVLQCLTFLNPRIKKREIFEYLLAISKQGFTEENIGNYLYILGLVPDSKIFEDERFTRNRINANYTAVEILTIFDSTLYDRLSSLKSVAHKVQRGFVEIFRNYNDITSKQDFVELISEKYPELNFSQWGLSFEDEISIALPSEHHTPKFDLMVGSNSPTHQFGILGESFAGRKVALDLSGTNTISLFGVQGGGKSYTIGTISEMVLKQFSHISELPAPLGGVIFHYSESMDYEPEFTSMMYPNDKERETSKLKERYGAYPNSLDDVIIICPKEKLQEKKLEFPSVEIQPINFHPEELNVKDWMFLLGALGSEANYVRQLKALIKKYRNNISIDSIQADVEKSILFTEFERALTIQKLDFAREYVDESCNLSELLRPGRLIIVDLRDEFIDKDEALGLFVVILNVFSAVTEFQGTKFNKFIVFDEAHKYMDNEALTNTIVTAIREMRHKGVTLMLASQDPPSLPKAIIELSSVILLHKFNSPVWLEHIKTAITQLEILAPHDMSSLNPGEGFLWATKATDRSVTFKPLKVSTRPRVTKHGGATIQVGAKNNQSH